MDDSVIAAMREWIADCEWNDLVDPSVLSDDEVVAGVRRHYQGGVAQFVADLGE